MEGIVIAVAIGILLLGVNGLRATIKALDQGNASGYSRFMILGFLVCTPLGWVCTILLGAVNILSWDDPNHL